MVRSHKIKDFTVTIKLFFSDLLQGVSVDNILIADFLKNWGELLDFFDLSFSH